MDISTNLNAKKETKILRVFLLPCYFLLCAVLGIKVGLVDTQQVPCHALNPKSLISEVIKVWGESLRRDVTFHRLGKRSTTKLGSIPSPL